MHDISKYIKYVLLFTIFILPIVGCRDKRVRVSGLYVSDRFPKDTLLVNSNGTYIRTLEKDSVKYINKGKWYPDYDGSISHIMFDEWTNYGEIDDPYGNRKGMYVFLTDNSIFGNIDEIYLDTEYYYSYNRIEKP